MGHFVTIIIPTYDRAESLRRLLKSIQRQTYTDHEVIVIDDHSQDQAAYLSVISEYQKVLNLRYISNEVNRGAPYSRNLGIRSAKGDLLAFVDDDDEWDMKKLEEQVPRFADRGIGLVYTWAIAVDDKGDEIYRFNDALSGDVRKEILKRCFIPSSSVMTTKEAARSVGGFDERFPSCQDWDMWTRIIHKKYKVDVVKKNLMIYHKHGGPSIGTNENAYKGYKMYYRKHFTKYIRYFLLSRDVRLIFSALKKAYR